MKLTRPLLFAVVFVACALITPAVRAGSGCPDDPERCVERGVAVQRTSGVATPAATVSAPSTQAVLVVARKSVARKSVARPVHVVAHTTGPAPAPATPGMGMLLKLSGGTGGDVTWFPSRPLENPGASWVL